MAGPLVEEIDRQNRAPAEAHLYRLPNCVAPRVLLACTDDHHQEEHMVGLFKGTVRTDLPEMKEEDLQKG